jgi:UDP-galactopyranose mutase
LTTRDSDPYYPLRTKEDISIFNEYIKLANNTLGVTFIGRLGTYRYLDMHIVIEESLNLAKYCKVNEINKWPSFANTN